MLKTTLMQVILRFFIATANALYAVLKLLPVEHKIVFISRQADSPSRDFRMLAAELTRRDDTLDVRFLCRTMRESLPGRVAYVGEVIRQMWHLATAQACVVDGYAIPVSVLAHKRDLFVLQMWHALGAIKKFGYQSLDRPGGRSSAIATAMRMHRNYDAVLCGSPAMVPVFAEAFGVDSSIVKPLGIPRADYLLSQAGNVADIREKPTIQELRKRSPRLDDTSKITVLYAPTLGRKTSSAYNEIISAADPDRYTLLVKPHDLEPHSVSGEHVVDATGISVLDLLLISDVLVTDYSAVAFEACLLDKPLYFYVSDIAEYERAYGLNINPLEVFPEAASVDIGELFALIGEGTGGENASRVFRERYATVGNGCTERIADMIERHLAGPEVA